MSRTSVVHRIKSRFHPSLSRRRTNSRCPEQPKSNTQQEELAKLRGIVQFSHEHRGTWVAVIYDMRKERMIKLE